jgi:SH3 domain protein
MGSFIRSALALFGAVALAAASVQAAETPVRYVSDQLRIEVREGPGMDYPVQTTLVTGARFAVLEESADWLRVRWPEGEGWIRSQYTVAQPVARLRLPEAQARAAVAEARAKQLEAELAPLQDTLATAEATRGELEATLLEQTAAYEALQALAGDAAQTYEALQALKQRTGELEAVQRTLIEENTALEANQQVEGLKWGGLIGLGGVLLGFLLGRAGRRQSSSWV